MAKRGRKPTPLPVLKLHGSSALRKGKNKGREEVQAPVGLPDEPQQPAIAAEIWKATIEQLAKTPGLLSKMDGAQLERYARFLARWREVEAEIEKLTKDAGAAWKLLGSDELRPALRGLWAESRRLDQALKEIEANFGMSPSARRGLAVPAQPRPAQLANTKPA